MIVSTGLSVASEPTYQKMLERAGNELKLMVSGKKDLEFLLESDCLLNANVMVVDEQYSFKIDIPVARQTDAFRPARRRGVKAGNAVMRNDPAQQVANEAAIQSLEHSSSLVDRVARAMAISSNLRAELAAIEKREGVDTEPARRHIYHKQAQFFVEVDDKRITFDSYAVRTAATKPGELTVATKLSVPRSDAVVHGGLVEESTAQSSESAAALGRKAQFRFVGMNWWQRVVLEAAKYLGLPVEVLAQETLSTCTGKYLPLDVNVVTNFDDLVKKTFLGLHDVIEAANDDKFGSLAADRLPDEKAA